MATWIIDWVGENPRQNENIALEPRFLLLVFQLFREGKVTCVSVVLETELAGAHTHKRDHEYLHDITMTTPLRFST